MVMDGALLVLNGGLTSIKFQVFQMAGGGVVEKLARGRVGELDGPGFFKARCSSDGSEEFRDLEGSTSNARALDLILDYTFDKLGDVPLVAAAHRFVHGGEHYRAPIKITPSVLLDLEKLTYFSPMHTPRAIDVIWSLLKQNGSMPQIACFDTAFHTTDEQIIHQYPLVNDIRSPAMRRFGFHGISYDFVSRTLKKVAPEAFAGRAVAAHIGGSVSLCALQGGYSIDFVGGSNKMDGLPTMTSSGSIDTSALLSLMSEQKLSVEGARSLLYLHSGLNALDKESLDFKTLLESDRPAAKNALTYFVYRLTSDIGGMMMANGGMDAFIFTGTVAEKSPRLRTLVLEKLAWLGVEYDEDLNQASTSKKPVKLSTEKSKLDVWIVPTDEERMIASYAMSVLK